MSSINPRKCACEINKTFEDVGHARRGEIDDQQPRFIDIAAAGLESDSLTACAVSARTRRGTSREDLERSHRHTVCTIAGRRVLDSVVDLLRAPWPWTHATGVRERGRQRIL